MVKLTAWLATNCGSALVTSLGAYSMQGEKNADVLTVILDTAGEVFGAAISPADNFFDVGGDSVSAIELATLLGNRFNREIGIELIVESATFAALALSLAKWIFV